MERIAQFLGVARSILFWSDKPFQARRAASFYGQFVRPGDLCFDIGAHLGSRVGPLLYLGARVIAVEPQPNLVRIMRRWYAGNPNVTVLEQAVGAAPGAQTMLVCLREPTVSTLSPEWIAGVKQSRKWDKVSWDRRISVPVTTLDHLIAAYGRPAFCKIDTEGYEHEVLRGLSQPIPILSFEYNPLTIDLALRALDRLGALGDYEFNPSPGNDLELCWPAWGEATQLVDWLGARGHDDAVGDVYARLKARPTAA